MEFDLFLTYCVVESLVFMCGCFVGRRTMKWKQEDESTGVIFVDVSDPENPSLQVGLSEEDLADICEGKDTAIFTIVRSEEPIS